jgi:hypothetical protein
VVGGTVVGGTVGSVSGIVGSTVAGVVVTWVGACVVSPDAGVVVGTTGRAQPTSILSVQIMAVIKIMRSFILSPRLLLDL